MARAKSPEKRTAILAAATEEIAASGIAAATAKIAKRAGIAEGTLFTYFPTKDALFNAVYLQIKRDGYAHLFTGFPAHASLEERTRHVWSAYVFWMAHNPLPRRAMTQLKVSDIITPATREEAASEGAEIQTMLDQLSERSGSRALSTAFISALMLSMQEVAVEFITKHPRQRDHYLDAAFTSFWHAVK